MNRQALAALDSARPSIARLDRSRHPEELAADLIEAWGAVETALRSLIGGSAMSGQTLIREARQRQLISFDQANALAAFQAARERAQDTTYKPSEQDINAAREGFLKLEASMMAPPSTEPVPATPGEAMSTKGLRHSPLRSAVVVSGGHRAAAGRAGRGRLVPACAARYGVGRPRRGVLAAWPAGARGRRVFARGARQSGERHSACISFAHGARSRQHDARGPGSTAGRSEGTNQRARAA
jgi:hypothetical protein